MSTPLGNGSDPISGFLTGQAGAAQGTEGIQVKAFVLNLAIALGTFAVQTSGFFLLKSSAIGRRIYQPKTYLVAHRLRVESVPVSPLRWLRRIWGLEDKELQAKCGLDGYFFIRLLRAMLLIFVPAMCLIVPVLLPINYHGGKDTSSFRFNNETVAFNVTGLDTLSWQNVSPAKTHRYWGHLVCAVGIIIWALYRIYVEKVNFIDVRQKFLTSPEHRLKASARTVLVTNIPTEYRSQSDLETLYDVFVDNDDHDKLSVWINRDYSALRNLTNRRRTLRHQLEKAELKLLRKANKSSGKERTIKDTTTAVSKEDIILNGQGDGSALGSIEAAFVNDCKASSQNQTESESPSITLMQQGDLWQPKSSIKFWTRGSTKKVPKIAWLRYEIARLTIEIEAMLENLDDDTLFKKQNSAFIQFERQMSAHMCCALVSHDKAGRMAPRFLEASPHEILWPNMNVTSVGRAVKTCIALILFAAMLFLWGIPTTILATLSQLDTLRASVSWLSWLRTWPSWIVSLISGPGVSILLFLLVQLVVPALCRKLAVLVGAPTRTRRELVAQDFYFTFLFIELVLVTSISSGIANVIPRIVNNPTGVPLVLANDLPRTANYFFNYLVVQSLTFTGSLLFQYLRILYITTIWPWFTQTPREEAWLQTTIPHQMWANQYSLATNFAAIGFIYCIISPLMLIFVSVTFSLFWVAYRHNYYYVQRNKIDTHGLLFNNALSQLFAGVYVLEIALIGLFFLVRDSQNDVVCTPQAIIMIIVLVFTAIFHFVMEQHLRPLYEFLPVTLEDDAADAERQRFLQQSPNAESDPTGIDAGMSTAIELSSLEKKPSHPTSLSPLRPPSPHYRARAITNASTATAASARHALSVVKRRALTSTSTLSHALPIASSKSSNRSEAADQLGAAIASYPDSLADLSPEERSAHLKAAYQDPVTREPRPVIWIPSDEAGLAEESVQEVKHLYGGPKTEDESARLTYSCEGARLLKNGKVQITRPAPDIRADWCFEWQL